MTATVLTITKTDVFIPLWQLIAVNLTGTTLTAPTDATSALSTSWSQLGLLGSDGITMTPSQTRNPIKAAQFGATVAQPVTDSGLTFKATMMETNLNALRVAFGSAVTESSAGGAFAINPGASSGALQTVIDSYDSTGRCIRTIFPSAEAGVSGDIAIAVTGTERSLPLTWNCYPDASNNCAYEFYSWLTTGTV